MNNISPDERAVLTDASRLLSEPLHSVRSSFILHAPLEFSVRAQLLDYVSPHARPAVLTRISAAAARYATLDARVAQPSAQYATTQAALVALDTACAEHDVDAADAAIAYIAQNEHPREIRAALIDRIAPSLAAAAHAPILLADLEHLAQLIPDAALLLRAPVRQLARERVAPIAWYTASYSDTTNTAMAAIDLFDTLAKPPQVMAPSTSIAPTVSATVASGLPNALLRPALLNAAVPDATRTLLRVAACSMLQEDAKHAPYGWTHCLTIPLGLLQHTHLTSNGNALIAIAATHVLAFRATLGQSLLRKTFDTPPTLLPQEVIDQGAQHHDAHVAKYVFACISAATFDTDCAPLYYAAAERLLGWWREHDGQRA